MAKKDEKPRFTKTQLVNSKKWAEQKDLAMTWLQDGKSYTHEEVKDLIDKFLNRKVGK